MKTNYFLNFYVFLLCSCTNAFSQIDILNLMPSHGKYWVVNSTFGYDFPSVNNGVKNIDYKKNFIVGGNISHFWSWYGFGVDFDYTKTFAKSNYPASGLYFSDSNNTQVTSYSLSENSISRFFLGIGPNLKLDVINRAIILELSLKAGISSFNGGRVQLYETTTEKNQMLLFHSGYDAKSSFATKGRFDISFFPDENKFGFSVGVYFIKHHKITESVDDYYGKSVILQPYKKNVSNTVADGPLLYRNEPCDCEASSYGGYISLKLRILKEDFNKTSRF